MRYDDSGSPIGQESPQVEGFNLRLEILKKPNLNAVLRSYLKRVEDLETAAWSLFTGRFLDTCHGAALERWGRLVGELPGGEPEGQYRVRIRIRILVNRSEGSIPDLTRIGNMMFGHPEFIVWANRKSLDIHVFKPVTTGVTRTQIVRWFGLGKVAGESLRVWRSSTDFPLICRSVANPTPVNPMASVSVAIPNAGSMMGGF